MKNRNRFIQEIENGNLDVMKPKPKNVAEFQTTTFTATIKEHTQSVPRCGRKRRRSIEVTFLPMSQKVNQANRNILIETPLLTNKLLIPRAIERLLTSLVKIKRFQGRYFNELKKCFHIEAAEILRICLS